jgi:hypothetical protein
MDGMTQVERQMYQVLQKKKQEVVEYLIQKVSVHNKDFE